MKKVDIANILISEQGKVSLRPRNEEWLIFLQVLFFLNDFRQKARKADDLK
jgi:hypothetical protein